MKIINILRVGILEGFENGRAIVFKHMEDGAEATVIEMGVQGGIGP